MIAGRESPSVTVTRPKAANYVIGWSVCQRDSLSVIGV